MIQIVKKLKTQTEYIGVIELTYGTKARVTAAGVPLRIKWSASKSQPWTPTRGRSTLTLARRT